MRALVVMRESRRQLRCGYCRSALARQPAWGCPRCGTLHHQACAFENGRCTVFGCSSLATSEAPGPWGGRIVAALLGWAVAGGILAISARSPGPHHADAAPALSFRLAPERSRVPPPPTGLELTLRLTLHVEPVFY